MRWIAIPGAIAGLGLLLSACALLKPADHSATAMADLPGQMEPVHAAVIAQNQAVFWVTSNGCTAKGDLTPVVRRSHGETVITLRRIKEDRCTVPVREGLEVRWTFEEMGLPDGARVSIENPYQMPQA
jgi:hypothetical protein